MCEINNGRKHAEPGLSNHKDKTGQYNLEEIDVNNKAVGEDIDKEEHYDSDSDSEEKNTPLLSPMNESLGLPLGRSFP